MTAGSSVSDGPVRRPTSRFEWSGRFLQLYSERLPIKYLVSNQGVCLGIDTKRRSFLFIASAVGILARVRPVGDTVVETLDYDIGRIVRALREPPGPTAVRR